MSPTTPLGTIVASQFVGGDGIPVTGTTPAKWFLVDLRATVGTGAPIPITPTSISFTGGAWTGSVSALQAATSMYLQVNGGGVISSGGTFDVIQRGLSLSMPANVNENAGAISTATLSLTGLSGSDLSVSLVSSDPGRLSVPATITIPAGQNSVPLPITVIDNGLLDGIESINITATATGAASGSGAIVVHDDETASLSVRLPSSALEPGGPVSGTITATAAPDKNITIQLSSSLPGRATVPVTVTLPAGQTSVGFNLGVINNTLIDGNASVTVSAAADNWTGGSAIITVVDDDPAVSVTIPASAWEGQTLTGAGTVSIAGPLGSSLVVSLFSSDTTELALPATVTILAGQTTATFSLLLPADGLKDGGQSAHVTASAGGLNDGVSGNILVHDADLDHIGIDAITGPKTAGVAFAVAAHAYNIDSEQIAVFGGAASLTAAGQTGSLSVTPTPATFAAGVWNSNVAVNALDPLVRLSLTAGSITGVSNTFAVQAGAMTGFSWTGLDTTQYLNAPFTATINATDANGYPVSSFNGNVTLSGAIGIPSINMLGSVVHTSASLASARTVGYSFTPSSNVTITHVLSYFGTKVSIWTDSGTLLASHAVSGTAATWTETALTTPIMLVAGTTYRVGAYTSGAVFYDRLDMSATTPMGTIGQSFFRVGDGMPTAADSAKWWLVDLKGNISAFTPVPMTPGTATLSGGVWTGSITVTQLATGMHLRADGGGTMIGDSGVFSVLPVAPTQTPALAAASDTGAPGDNLTRLNNFGSTLQFNVAGTSPGATVTLYLNGTTPIGSAIATGTTTLVTTDGTTMLPDGNASITARQTVGGNESPASGAVQVAIDTTPPTFEPGYPVFNYLTGPQSVVFRFNEAVSGAQSGNFDMSSISPAASVLISVTYAPANHTATITWPTVNGNTGILPDANYVASAATAITDLAGNPLPPNSMAFFFLNGDANHDRVVDTTDLRILADAFLTSGRDFASGDFNGDGIVNNADLAILTANWQKRLPEEPAPVPSLAASAPRTPTRRTPSRIVDLIE
jgi:hypothetical protein